MDPITLLTATGRSLLWIVRWPAALRRLYMYIRIAVAQSSVFRRVRKHIRRTRARENDNMDGPQRSLDRADETSPLPSFRPSLTGVVQASSTSKIDTADSCILHTSDEDEDSNLQHEIPIWRPDATFGPTQGRRKRALLIACSYKGLGDALAGWKPLPGTIQDVTNLRDVLRDEGWQDDEIRTLSDSDEELDPMRLPTKENIMASFRWLVEGAEAGDFLLCQLSGHGWQVPALEDTLETDGMDEFFFPCDGDFNIEFETFQKNCKEKNILDDDLKKYLVDPLPEGCKLLVLVDCCSSGTMLDLPHEHDDYQVPEEYTKAAKAYLHRPGMLPKTANPEQINARSRRRGGNVETDVKMQSTQRKIAANAHGIDGRVIAISSCRDGAETIEGPDGGLLTKSLCEILKMPEYRLGIHLGDLRCRLSCSLETKHESAVASSRQYNRAQVEAKEPDWYQSVPIPQFSFSHKPDWSTKLSLNGHGIN